MEIFYDTPDIDNEVDLYKYLLFAEDGPEDATLVRVQNIQKKMELSLFWEGPENIFFEHERRDVLRNRLRRLFHVISQNANIVGLSFVENTELHVPGSLLAEWFNENKYVKSFSLCFFNEQSDFQLLCNAIKGNNVIEKFGIGTKLEGTLVELASRACRDSKGIKDIDFLLSYENRDSEIAFLSEILGPNSNIQRSFLHLWHPTDTSAVAVGDIITANKSLSSLKVKSRVEHLLPILRGVLSSVNSGLITDFDIHFNNGSKQNEQQLLIFRMIGEMKNLRHFSFDLCNFDALSAEIIDANLKAISSLESLVVSIPHKNNFVKDVIKNIATWEKKCKMHIDISLSYRYYEKDETATVLSLFEDLWLEKLSVHVDPASFLDITKYIPKWKVLKDLEVSVYSAGTNENVLVENIQAGQLKCAAAVFQNGSLESVSVEWGVPNSDWHVDAQVLIDQALSRNKFLDLIAVAPARIPDWQWPSLLEMANPTGVDFSFQVMSYLVSRFLAAGKLGNDHLAGQKRKWE